MAIYARGKRIWYHFWWDGKHVCESTGQGNRRVAKQMEAAHRTRLAQGKVGIVERKPAPTFREFEKEFTKSVETRSAKHPATVQFYRLKMARLLEFDPLASARLDLIDERLIDSYVLHRSETVCPASVNRELATLRKALRMAHEWRLIDRVPKVRMLPGERNREFVLNHEQEALYIAAAPQPLKDAALLMIDTGMRVGEVRQLEWSDVHLDAVPAYIHIGCGKSKNAKRNLILSPRVLAMLKERKTTSKSSYVFTDESGRNPVSIFTLDGQNARVRDALNLPEMVVHSLRHTFGTRLGESGADAFQIMKAMGHSSVVMSQKYVHPTPEAMTLAFERLQALNQRKQLPATVSATVPFADSKAPGENAA